MNLGDFLVNYGYTLKDIVQDYIYTLKYKDTMVCFDKDTFGLESGNYLYLGNSIEEDSPFIRHNTYFTAYKDGKLFFGVCNYFNVGNEMLYMTEEPKFIIKDLDSYVCEKYYKNKDFLKYILFTKGNNIIGFNFLTKKEFKLKNIGKLIKEEDGTLLFLNDVGLVTYKTIENDPKDGLEYVDHTDFKFDKILYQDEKKIINCTRLDGKGSWDDIIGSIDSDIYKLDFEDETTRLLFLNEEKQVLSNYYKRLTLEETCIFTPVAVVDKYESECPDAGLTFEYDDGVNKGELLIDKNMNFKHREKVFIK